MTRWDIVEGGQPDQNDLDAAISRAEALPDDGDGGHVKSPFPIYTRNMPEITKADWSRARLKQVKIRKLHGSTLRLTRENLIWHLKHPGQSRYRGQWNTHPQVFEDSKGRQVVIDGHHRLAALKLLRVKKEQVWLLKANDLPLRT